MWGSETKKKGHSLREWYRFCICSNSSWFHLQSVWARGKRFFCSHHSTGGNETTSAADWNGLGCKWLRFCTLIRTPGASDYLQVGAAMTVIHGLITAGLSRSPPPRVRNKPQLKVKSGHLVLWKKGTFVVFLFITLWLGSRNQKRVTSKLWETGSLAHDIHRKQHMWNLCKAMLMLSSYLLFKCKFVETVMEYPASAS